MSTQQSVTTMSFPSSGQSFWRSEFHRIVELSAAAMQRFKTWQAYRQAEDELMAMTDRQLHDLGIRREDIRAVVYGEKNPQALRFQVSV